MNGPVGGTEEEVNEQWDPRLRFRIKALNLREWLVGDSISWGGGTATSQKVVVEKWRKPSYEEDTSRFGAGKQHGAGDAMFCMEVSTSSGYG